MKNKIAIALAVLALGAAGVLEMAAQNNPEKFAALTMA